MNKKNRTLVSIISRTFACFLMFFLATAVVAAKDSDQTNQPAVQLIKIDTEQTPGGQDSTNPNALTEEQTPPIPCDTDSIKDSFAGLKGKVDNLKKIQTLLKSGGYLTDSIDGVLGPETYQALARLCRYMRSMEMLKAESGEDLIPAKVLFNLLSVKKLKETDSQLQDQTSLISQLATDDCGCSRDYKDEVRVYGFLPYWLADGTRQTVDFSILDHIGFHALRLDENGNISGGSLWSDTSKSGPDIAKFINTAHRYGVKVDITFYMSDWMAWKGEDGAGKIKNAVKAIENSFNQEFSDTRDDGDVGANLISLLRKILPFVEDNSSVHADGINLYFDKYEEPDDAHLLILIIKALATKMPDVKFNIMLGLNWIDIKTQLFTELKPILENKSETDAGIGSGSDKKSDSVADRVDRLFVFLPRNTEGSPKNTSNSKKMLRQVIEEAFDGYGETRRTVLRKTIPILPTSQDAVTAHYFDKEYGGKSGQFVDDLIYLQNNFAGVGLWPLPMTPAVVETSDNGGSGDASQSTELEEDGEKVDSLTIDADSIGKRLIEEYQEQSWLNQLPPEIGFFLEKLCQFACPNRWLFRLAFDFLAAPLLIYGLLALSYCRLREYYQRRFPYFLVYGLVTVVVFSVSLVCDPFWKEKSSYVMFAVLVVPIGFISFRYVRRSMRPKLP